MGRANRHAAGPQAAVLAAAIMGTGFLSERHGTGLKEQAHVVVFDAIIGSFALPTTSRDQKKDFWNYPAT